MKFRRIRNQVSGRDKLVTWGLCLLGLSCIVAGASIFPLESRWQNGTVAFGFLLLAASGGYAMTHVKRGRPAPPRRTDALILVHPSRERSICPALDLVRAISMKAQ